MKFLLLMSNDGGAGERGGWAEVTGKRLFPTEESQNLKVVKKEFRLRATYFARAGKVSKAPPGAATHDFIVLSAPPPDPRCFTKATGKKLFQICSAPLPLECAPNRITAVRLT